MIAASPLHSSTLIPSRSFRGSRLRKISGHSRPATPSVSRDTRGECWLPRLTRQVSSWCRARTIRPYGSGRSPRALPLHMEHGRRGLRRRLISQPRSPLTISFKRDEDKNGREVQEKDLMVDHLPPITL